MFTKSNTKESLLLILSMSASSMFNFLYDAKGTFPSQVRFKLFRLTTFSFCFNTNFLVKVRLLPLRRPYYTLTYLYRIKGVRAKYVKEKCFEF